MSFDYRDEIEILRASNAELRGQLNVATSLLLAARTALVLANNDGAESRGDRMSTSEGVPRTRQEGGDVETPLPGKKGDEREADVLSLLNQTQREAVRIDLSPGVGSPHSRGTASSTTVVAKADYFVETKDCATDTTSLDDDFRRRQTLEEEETVHRLDVHESHAAEMHAILQWRVQHLEQSLHDERNEKREWISHARRSIRQEHLQECYAQWMERSTLLFLEYTSEATEYFTKTVNALVAKREQHRRTQWEKRDEDHWVALEAQERSWNAVAADCAAVCARSSFRTSTVELCAQESSSRSKLWTTFCEHMLRMMHVHGQLCQKASFKQAVDSGSMLEQLNTKLAVLEERTTKAEEERDAYRERLEQLLTQLEAEMQEAVEDVVDVRDTTTVPLRHQNDFGRERFGMHGSTSGSPRTDAEPIDRDSDDNEEDKDRDTEILVGIGGGGGVAMQRRGASTTKKGTTHADMEWSSPPRPLEIVTGLY